MNVGRLLQRGVNGAWLPLLVSLATFSASANAAACDIDGDNDVDRQDIDLILAARNQPAEPGDPRDNDGNGVINVLDARQCVVQCTLPRCAEPATTPEVTITDPTEGAFFAASPIVVSGTVNDPSIRVTVQDVVASVDGTNFVAEDVLLVEGPNELVARAFNNVGEEFTATRLVTLDTIAPALIVTSPRDRSIVTATPVAIIGTVLDATQVACMVKGAEATVDDTVFNGTAVLGEGENIVTVNCEDAAGNTASLPLTLFFDETPIEVISIDPADGATDVPPTGDVIITFSDAVNPSSVDSSSVFLSAGARILPADIVVSQDGLIVTLTPAPALPSGTPVTVTITTGITDAAGIPLAATVTSSFTTAGVLAGPGIIIGQVFDDVLGIPIEDATVEAVALDSGQSLEIGTTDERGRYVLDPGQSQVRVGISKLGFTIADRVISNTEGIFVDVLDARLTPISAPDTLSALLGSEITNSAGDTLTIPPGAIASDMGISFTAISEQGPRSPFPLGWAPISIASVDGPDSFNPPATIAMGEHSGDMSGRAAVFARYDESSAEWVALADVVLPTSGPVEFTNLNGSGQIALVVADTGEGAPAAALPGEPLTAATLIPIPDTATATGVVEPAVGRADDPTPAAATVTITDPEPLRSGTTIRGDFMELFILRDGDRVVPFDRSQDLIAYRSPADTDDRIVVANFPIAPTVTFNLAEVSEGTVTVSLLADEAVGANIIDGNGGGIQIDDGSRVIVPSAALAVDTPVSLSRLDESTFPVTTAGGVTFIGGLEFDLTGAQTSAPVSLSLGNAASLVPTGSEVIVTEVRTIRDRQRLVIIALARIQGNDLTTITEVNGVTLPGIRNGGRYGFYRFDGALQIVQGSARDEAGRRDGHVIELESLPFVSVTDANGAFALVSPTGDFTVIATGAEIADQVHVAGNTAIPLSEVVITATPPEVESITVRRPPVAGNFAGPLALLGVPAPTIDDSAGGDGDGEIEAGETVALTLSVRNDGTIAMEDGSIAIQIDGPDGRIDTAPANISFENLPPNEPFTVGPLVFSVPGNVDPALIRYTLIHSNAGGFANVIPFDLPFDVEHPRVPVGSEITVQFSEPVTDANVIDSITLDQEDPTGQVPTPTNVIVSADRTTVTVRPLAELVDDTVYSITLTDAIVDDDGRPLTDAPVVGRLSTEDQTPPAQIAPGQIEASVPDTDGFVTITGSPGTVNPEDIDILLNQRTGVTVLATVNPDGSFEARIRAEVSDLITIIVRDRNSNETTIDITEYVNRDPVTGNIISTVIGSKGGTINGPGNLQLTIPTGALIGATELSVAPVADPFELPADLAGDPAVVAAFNSLFSIAARVQINADSNAFAGPIGLSLAAPTGSNVGDLFVIARSQTVTIGGPLIDLDRVTGLALEDNPIQTVERLEIIETATVKDAGGELILSTDSPPFPGITSPGVLTLLRVNGPLTFLAGEVRRDSESGLRVRDVLVTSLPGTDATSVFAAVTDTQGQFVVADTTPGGQFSAGDEIASRLDARDPDFARVIRRDVRGIVGPPSPPGTVVAHLVTPFVLPTRIPQPIVDIIGDLEPPIVTVSIEGESVVDRFARVGEPLTLRVTAEDNDEIANIGLEVDQGLGFVNVALAADGSGEFVPSNEAVVALRGNVRDRTGNITFVDLLVRTIAVPPGEPLVPTPIPGPPVILRGAPTLTPFDEPICLLFSEPIDTTSVNASTFQMFDSNGTPQRLRYIFDSANAEVCAVPERSLTPEESYQVEVTPNVTDIGGEQFAGHTDESSGARPEFLFTKRLSNVEDVAVFGESLLAVTHPNGAAIGDNGTLHSFAVVTGDDEKIDALTEIDRTPTLGRPLSLAVDGTRVFVGNRFLGAVATKEPVVTTFIPGTILEVPDVILGCSPLAPVGAPIGCTGIDLVDSTFPRPPSNLEVFDLSDPTRPERVGGVATNSIPPNIWDPNTWPHRVEATMKGVAVTHFLGNVELFTAETQPQSLLNVGPIRRYGEIETDFEVRDAAYFDGFAVVAENSGVRIVSTKGDDRPTAQGGDPLLQEKVVTLSRLPITGAQFIGSVPKFEWRNESGDDQISDLVFVSTADDRLAIFNVTDPQKPTLASVVFGASGNISFDACRGVAYLYGSDGEINVVDFNVPTSARTTFTVSAETAETKEKAEALATLGRPTFNGNDNHDGNAYFAGEGGIGVLQVGGPCAAFRSNGVGSVRNASMISASSAPGSNSEALAADLPSSICPLRPPPRFVTSGRLSCQFSIDEAWSDQFPGIKNNFLPDGAGSSDGGYVLMGARDPDARGYVRIKLKTNQFLNDQQKSQLLFRLQRIDAMGNDVGLPSGASHFIENEFNVVSVSAALLPFSSLGDNNNDYVVVGWHDGNQNGKLDSAEISISDDRRFRIISLDRYEESLTVFRNIAAGTRFPHLRFTRRHILSFINNSSPEDARKSNEVIELKFGAASKASPLTHHVGILPISDSEGDINRYDYESSSDLAIAVREHPKFRQFVADAVFSELIPRIPDIHQSLSMDSDGVDEFGPWQANENSLSFDVTPTCNNLDGPIAAVCDLFFAFGAVNVELTVQPRIRLSGNQLIVESVSLNGRISDIYDWDFNIGTELFDRNGAAIQAGFFTLGIADFPDLVINVGRGQVFKTYVDITMADIPWTDIEATE